MMFLLPPMYSHTLVYKSKMEEAKERTQCCGLILKREFSDHLTPDQHRLFLFGLTEY